MYCTVEEVRQMIKDDALNSIIGNSYIAEPAEREAKLQPIIMGAIEDAGSEIDGYLAKRYPTPMNPCPNVICKFCKDIALYNLFSRMGIDEQSREKNYLTRYNAAVKFLTLVAEGKVSIEMESSGPAAAAQSGFVMNSSNRLFSRKSLKGM